MMVCQLCNSSKDNEVVFGEMLTEENVTVHYFCLLLSPALYTRGEEDQGIRGFLIEDIRKECRRVKSLACVYCNHKFANLGCSKKTCKMTFHLDCLLKMNGAVQFSDPFETFCLEHKKVKEVKNIDPQETCSICVEKIGRGQNVSNKFLRIPCCNKLFHRSCLQKYATTAGVCFKCPLCNDKENCSQSLPKLGIFMPEKDADWEFDESTEEELFEENERICENKNCEFPNVNYSEYPWKFKICSTCGADVIHIECLENQDSDYNCRSCTEIITSSAREENSQQSSNNFSFETSYLEENSIDDDSPIKAPKRFRSKRIESSDSEESIIDMSPIKAPKRRWRIESSDSDWSPVKPPSSIKRLRVNSESD